MPLIFPPERVARMRERPRQTYGTLRLRSETYRTLNDPRSRDCVYQLYREYVAHDADGNAIGKRIQAVRENPQTPVKATVILVETVDTTASEDRPWGRALTAADANACGFSSVAALRAAWGERHTADFAQMVWFALGNWRGRG